MANMPRKLNNTISRHVERLFTRRGATLTAQSGTNPIVNEYLTATSKVTRKTVDRHTQKLLVARSNLTVSG